MVGKSFDPPPLPLPHSGKLNRGLRRIPKEEGGGVSTDEREGEGTLEYCRDVPALSGYCSLVESIIIITPLSDKKGTLLAPPPLVQSTHFLFSLDLWRARIQTFIQSQHPQ